jgi:hypothetical protein
MKTTLLTALAFIVLAMPAYAYCSGGFAAGGRDCGSEDNSYRFAPRPQPPTHTVCQTESTGWGSQRVVCHQEYGQ